MMVSFRKKWLTMDALCNATLNLPIIIVGSMCNAIMLIMQTGYEVSIVFLTVSVPVVIDYTFKE